MSKPMKKGTKRLLIALTAVVLLGVCFGSVALYAHHETTKPRFKMPDTVLPSVRELPEDKADAVAYVTKLYNEAVNSDDVEGSWHTDAKVKDYDEAMETPFAAADEELIRYIWEHAGDRIKDDMYPKEDDVLQCGLSGAFALDITAADVLDFTAERGRYNDKNEYYDDDYYYITLNVSPDTIDTAAIPGTDVYAKFVEEFAPALRVEQAEFEALRVKMEFKIARAFDELSSLEITRAYRVSAEVTPTEGFAALLPEGGTTAQVTLPYEATEKIGFRHYGAHFSQACMAVTKGDQKAMPAAVTVKKDETKDNYTLTFTESDPEVISIDEDGVMTVLKAAEEPVAVTMTLTYGGHTYTDTMTVYVTELEVETNAQQ